MCFLVVVPWWTMGLWYSERQLFQEDQEEKRVEFYLETPNNMTKEAFSQKIKQRCNRLVLPSKGTQIVHLEAIWDHQERVRTQSSHQIHAVQPNPMLDWLVFLSFGFKRTLDCLAPSFSLGFGLYWRFLDFKWFHCVYFGISASFGGAVKESISKNNFNLNGVPWEFFKLDVFQIRANINNVLKVQTKNKMEVDS